MKINPQLLALFTAMAWGFGGFFEKQGLKLGNLSPQMGITIRTAVAFLILGAVSFSEWKQVPQAGPKALGMMVLGGGVVAGAVGMLCFYAALKGAATVNEVMPIAFTSPFFGALIGLAAPAIGRMLGLDLHAETLSPRLIIGMLMTIGGIVVISFPESLLTKLFH
jgi:transporter family protein